MKKEKLTLRQQEKIFKEILLAYFGEKGYSYFHEYQNSNFRLFKDKTLDQFTIYGLTGSGKHSFVHEFSFLELENILIEIGLPNYDITNYRLGKSYFFTVRNNHVDLGYNTDLRPVESEQDCLDYCQSIITYMETGGKAFVERYSYLPHILEEMDKNTLEGINWSYGVFSGTAGAFFKGLLISKLCNDANFNEKIELVDNIYYPVEHNLQEFIPYYEKLKERLKTIEPIYNC